MVQIEIKSRSTHWTIRVTRGDEVLEVHTGKLQNLAWKKECLEKIKKRYPSHSIA